MARSLARNAMFDEYLNAMTSGVGEDELRRLRGEALTYAGLASALCLVNWFWLRPLLLSAQYSSLPDWVGRLAILMAWAPVGFAAYLIFRRERSRHFCISRATATLPVCVYHTTGTNAASAIREERAIKPGSVWTNLGPGVYVSEDNPLDQKWSWIQFCVSWAGFRLTLIGPSKKNFQAIEIDVKDGHRMVWNGKNTWVVRDAVLQRKDNDRFEI